MADQEQKALELIAEAEKKQKSAKGFLGSLFGCHLNVIAKMSSNSKRFKPHDSPYNSREIARASATMKYEFEKGALRFLRHKFTLSGSSSFGNVWEGENGFMEHVKGSFPMPMKADEEEKSRESIGIDSKVKDAAHGSSSSSKVQKSMNAGKNNNSSNLNHSNSSLESTEDINENEESSSSFNRSNSLESTDDVKNNEVVVSDSDEDDCIVIEKEKEVIAIDDDDDSNLSASPSGVLSNDELIHWQRLNKLQEEISAAKQNFRKINTMFRYNKSLVKACDAITALHGRIVEMVNKLVKAKDDIDSHNFSLTLSKVMKEKCFSLKTSNCDVTTYEHIWTLLNNLCKEFVRVRKRRKAVLVEHAHFEKLSPKEFRSNLTSIRLKKTV